MLVKVEVSDHVYIRPHRLDNESLHFVSDEIKRKYCNNVIADVGLVFSLHEVLEIDDLMVHPTDGGATVKVRFSLLVFKPVVGEVMTGKIYESTPDGVEVSIESFKNIHIPLCYLQPPSTFDSTENLWIWGFEGHKLFMEIGEPIRFRVVAVHFAEPRPEIEVEGESASGASGGGARRSAGLGPGSGPGSAVWDTPATATLIRMLAADTAEYLAANQNLESERKPDIEAEAGAGAGAGAGASGSGSGSAVKPQYSLGPPAPAIAGLGATLSAGTGTGMPTTQPNGAPHNRSLVRLLRMPMCVIGDVSEDGLGLVSWWS